MKTGSRKVKDTDRIKTKEKKGSNRSLMEMEASIQRLLKENKSNLTSISGVADGVDQVSNAMDGLARLGINDEPSPPWFPPPKEARARIADLRDKDKVKIAKLIQQVVALGKENEELVSQQSLNNLNQEEELRGLKKENMELQSKCNGLRDSFAKSLLMLKDYQERLKSADNHIKKLEVEIETLNQQSASQAIHMQEIERLKQQVESLIKIIASERAEKESRLKEEVLKVDVTQQADLLEGRDKPLPQSPLPKAINKLTELLAQDEKEQPEISNEFLLSVASKNAKRPSQKTEENDEDQNQNDSKSWEKQDHEDSLLERFLEHEGKQRKLNQLSSKEHQNYSVQADTADFETRDGGLLDSSAFESSRFDESLFDVIDELEGEGLV